MITGNENKAIQEVKRLLEYSKYIEVKQFKKKRSSLQNRALHLFFRFVSDELNNISMSYQWKGLTEVEMEIPYTPDLVKEFVWRPIQKAMFGIESTTKLNTQQINEILDVIIKFFGEKGILVNFPSRIEAYKEFVKSQ